MTLEEFQCYEQNETTDFIWFDRLYVNIAYPRLLAKNVKIKHLHLDGFSGQIVQSGNKLNFSDLIERFAKRAEQADSTEQKWKVYLGDVKLTNSSINYHDVQHGKEWEIKHFNLSIPGLNLDKSDTNAGLDFVFPTGGKMVVEAKYEAPTNLLKLELDMLGISPNVALPLIQNYLNVSSVDAQMNGRLLVLIGLDNIQNIEVKGNVCMQNLHIRNLRKKEVASLDELRILLNRGELGTRKFILDSLVVQC